MNFDISDVKELLHHMGVWNFYITPPEYNTKYKVRVKGNLVIGLLDKRQLSILNHIDFLVIQGSLYCLIPSQSNIEWFPKKASVIYITNHELSSNSKQSLFDSLYRCKCNESDILFTNQCIYQMEYRTYCLVRRRTESINNILNG